MQYIVIDTIACLNSIIQSINYHKSHFSGGQGSLRNRSDVCTWSMIFKMHKNEFNFYQAGINKPFTWFASLIINIVTVQDNEDRPEEPNNDQEIAIQR